MNYLGYDDDHIFNECPVCNEPFKPTNDDEEYCSYHCATGG